MQEFDAATKEVEKQQKNTQLKQEYERQQQTFNQEIRERDYQIAQLQLSLVAVDDKLSLIPVVKSPRNGYIRRIKPWVGKNGKYETTLVISNTPPNKSSDSGSSSED
jgi:multidrug resistance efflux pump